MTHASITRKRIAAVTSLRGAARSEVVFHMRDSVDLTTCAENLTLRRKCPSARDELVGVSARVVRVCPR
jgi:hypothetical protein